MAFVQHRQSDSYVAASAVGQHMPVGLDTIKNQVVPLTAVTARPIGLTDATAAQGAAVTVHEETSVAKAVCAASVGVGVDVGVASTNGALGPVTGASGVTRWAIGQSREAAAAGETFAVYIHPRQISNLI